MKNKLIKIAIFAIMTISAIVLAFSIRGNPGSPSADELNNPEWKENGPFELSPERGRFTLLYSIIEDNSLSFSLPLARFTTPDLGYIDGKYVSLFAPAVSYLAMPGYIIGRAFGASQFGSFVTSAIFALGNVYLIYLIAIRLGSSKIAGLLGGLTFVFATPGFAYAVNLYQHHISTFIILMSSYLAISYTSWFSLAMIWLLALTSLSVDYPNLVIMVPIAFYCVHKLIEVKHEGKLIIKLHIGKWLSVVGAIIPLLFFFWFNNASYGNPLQFSGTVQSVSKIDELGLPAIDLSQAEDNVQAVIDAEKQEDKTALGFFKSRSMLNGLYILLFSEDRGLLVFAPVLLFAFLGMVVGFKKHAKETVLFCSIITVNILLYSMWGDPWGGWAFGARYLIPSYAILAIFIALALSKWKKNWAYLLIYLVLVIYSSYINTAGALGSSANPPKVQVLQLEKITGRQEKYTYERNLDMLRLNTSKSFFYRAFAKQYMSSWQYFQVVYGTVVLLFVVLLTSLYLRHRGNKS